MTDSEGLLTYLAGLGEWEDGGKAWNQDPRAAAIAARLTAGESQAAGMRSALERARPHVEDATTAGVPGWLTADADLRAIDTALEGAVPDYAAQIQQLRAALEVCRPTIERCCDEPAINAMNAALHLTCEANAPRSLTAEEMRSKIGGLICCPKGYHDGPVTLSDQVTAIIAFIETLPTTTQSGGA